MIRRLKKDVELQLEPKIRQVVPILIPAKDRKRFRAMMGRENTQALQTSHGRDNANLTQLVRVGWF